MNTKKQSRAVQTIILATALASSSSAFAFCSINTPFPGDFQQPIPWGQAEGLIPNLPLYPNSPNEGLRVLEDRWISLNVGDPCRDFRDGFWSHIQSADPFYSGLLGLNIGPNSSEGPLKEGFTIYNVGLGTLSDGRSFIAKGLRITFPDEPFGEAIEVTYDRLIFLDDAKRSLINDAFAKNLTLSSIDGIFNGANSNPLQRRTEKGKSVFWINGDWGRDDHGSRSGTIGLAEIGVGYNFGPIQLNAAYGETWAKQHLPLSSDVGLDGYFLMAEAITSIYPNVWLTLGAFSHRGQLDTTRGYVTTAGTEFSRGDSDSDTTGWRARADWENLITSADISLSPYIDVTRVASSIDGYTEVGGSFTAQFNKKKDKYTDYRLGFNARKRLTSSVDLIGTMEGVWRDRSGNATVSGQLAEAINFSQETADSSESWARAAIGLEGKIANGVGAITVNATSKGEAANAWIAANWRYVF